MAFSERRLTLYALISGLEEDLRELIDLHMAAAGKPAAVLGEEIYERALARLKQDSSNVALGNGLSDLLPYLDFSETFHVLNRGRSQLPAELGSWLKDRTASFEKIGQIRNRVMHFRPLELTDLPTVEAACESLRLQWKDWIDGHRARWRGRRGAST